MNYFPLTLLVISPLAMAVISPAAYVTESGIEITPVIATSIQHDDNITNENESDNKISSMLFELEPSIFVKATHGDNYYYADYILTNGNYFSSSEDNYLDHQLDFISELNINQRNRLYLAYEFDRLHEARGTGISEGISSTTDGFDEPIEYSAHYLHANYAYGSEGAKGQIVGSVGYYDRSYENFREVTQFRDYDENHYGAAFYYRMASSTRLFVDIRREDRRYQTIAPQQPSLDNDVTYYYVGAEWDITGKTSGIAKFGLQDKRFRDGNRSDFRGNSWDVKLSWSPRQYSTLSLSALQQAKDPDQAGDYVKETAYTFGWQHFWRERFYTDLTYTHSDESYTGVNRDDTTRTWQISASYDMRRWLSFTLGWDYSDRTSSQPGIDSNKQIWSLTATLSL
ncbi:outer membrane beta-barrel protein [Photobacterium sp. MCCC 1A19761]|uniref:outer membrane beta-barrel protein n=1 Tax=Photobacterium sp. MCCC 1A19761 TaxID=3115000 RepID=UPI00307DC360